VSIPQDRLPGDDRRLLVVPVVSALPVVFVDQFGEDEDPERNRFGETYRLRRLLAPVTSRSEQERLLIQVRHVKADRVDRTLLEDARLVVVAGLRAPPPAVPVLREYVEQGGFLVIAAGGDFDPPAWTETAWADGLGILPAPLEPTPVGRLPGRTAGRLEPFQLDFATLIHEYFLLEQTSREELEDLYSLPYFFKAVRADLSDEVQQQMTRTVAAEVQQRRSRLADATARLAELAQKEVMASLSEAERQERDRLEQARADAEPRWLLWQRPELPSAVESLSAKEIAERTRPRVLAALTNGVPLLIERDVGLGQVLFISTGVFRDWNTLTSTNAVLVFDRIFRDMLRRTLPRRNITSSEQLLLPVPPDLRYARFSLTRPDGQEEPIAVEALGSARHGITLGNLVRRGHYRITAYGTEETPQAGVGAKLWEVPLSVNGPAHESDLSVLDSAELSERMGETPYRWVEQDQTIQLAGAPIRGQDLWKWLLLAVLLCLLVELAVLARPVPPREGTG
jgi:hypothetical protein